MAAGELLQGVRSKREAQEVSAFLELFPIHSGSARIARQALTWLEAYGVSHGVSYFDCYLAATAWATDSILVTLNSKHFRCFPDLEVELPEEI